jgi:hypothetical protein
MVRATTPVSPQPLHHSRHWDRFCTPILPHLNSHEVKNWFGATLFGGEHHYHGQGYDACIGLSPGASDHQTKCMHNKRKIHSRLQTHPPFKTSWGDSDHTSSMTGIIHLTPGHKLTLHDSFKASWGDSDHTSSMTGIINLTPGHKLTLQLRPREEIQTTQAPWQASSISL